MFRGSSNEKMNINWPEPEHQVQINLIDLTWTEKKPGHVILNQGEPKSDP